jgi:hypothetical protein
MGIIGGRRAMMVPCYRAIVLSQTIGAYPGAVTIYDFHAFATFRGDVFDSLRFPILTLALDHRDVHGDYIMAMNCL